jgi:hypothetical protein
MTQTKDPRRRTPSEIELSVLELSRRRCALCFHLNEDLREKHGQIAHLDDDRTNYAEDNLAFLCMEHHSLYDSTTSQHKNYTIHEVKKARTVLYDAIIRGRHVATTKVVVEQGHPAESKHASLAYCQLHASVLVETDVLIFFLFNETDYSVKELQISVVDQGAINRYVKKGLKSGQHPTEQGIELAGRTITVGPLPTILPHARTELKQLRRDINDYTSWYFIITMQTDSHLFRGELRLKKLSGGGLTVSNVLALTDPNSAPRNIWEMTSDNFPKDFSVE